MKRALPWVLLLAGCAGDPPRRGRHDREPADGGPDWGDVAPLLDRCVGCHDRSGLTWPLTTYDEVRQVAPIVGSVVASRRMPPWPAGPGDVAFRDDPTLSAEEIETLVAWADAGAPLGRGDPDRVGVAAGSVALPRVDGVFEMPEPYEPQGPLDDHRCFVLDGPVLGEGYVTGIEVLPGERSVAHHVSAMGFAAEPGSGEPFATDAAYPGAGWGCDLNQGNLNTLPGESVRLGGWVPGRGAQVLPEGTGLYLPPDAHMILRMHYWTPTWNGTPDRSRFQVMFEPAVRARAVEVPVSDPRWGAHRDIAVAAGSSETQEYERAVSELVSEVEGLDPDGDVAIHRALVHMHQHGVRGTIEALHEGRWLVVLDIPAWDFDWQLEYWLAEPLILAPTDRMRVRCVYENPGDEDVWWGNGTEDEMCTGWLLASNVGSE